MANFIHPTAIIYEDVEIGDNNYIGAYCIIGAPPEHKNIGIILGLKLLSETIIK